MSRKEISRFTVGGTEAGASIPSGVIQRALGTKIMIHIGTRVLDVPTPTGMKRAEVGDTIIAYDDDTFDVEYKEGLNNDSKRID